MRHKYCYVFVWMLILSMLFSLIPVSAQGDDTLPPDFSASTEEFDHLGSDEVSVMSIAQPVKAYLVVNTNCYLAPNPNLGHKLGAIPSNTEVWVVEKAKCPDNNMHYYYCGFTYNGASHRGYFSSDNVYRNGSRYMPDDVEDEYRPAYSKRYTSVAGTVYAGPGTSYATVGTVGQENIKLIRTEGNYNFIQYEVTSTEKVKRGFLHYSNITGSWANLTAQNAELDGQTFYIRRGNTAKYWGTVGNSTAENTRIQLQDFTGDTGQIYKFIYNSSGKYFYIQPAVGYNADRRVEIQWDSGIEHENRKLYLKPSGVVLRQQFWVIKMSNGCYKFVPRSSYGTMALSARSGYVNQYYTTSNDTNTNADIWKLEATNASAGANQYPVPSMYLDYGFCWLSSAKMLASAENSNIPNYDYFDLALLFKEIENIRDGGTVQESAEVANFLLDGTSASETFAGIFSKRLSETGIRKLIKNGHGIIIAEEQYVDGNASNSENIYSHQFLLNSFYWNDTYRKYYYTIYDPIYVDTITQNSYQYSTLCSSYGIINPINDEYTRWTNVAGYNSDDLTNNLLDIVNN